MLSVGLNITLLYCLVLQCSQAQGPTVHLLSPVNLVEIPEDAGFVETCVEVTGQLDQPLTVTVETRASTATEGTDYVETTYMHTFRPEILTRQICLNITILLDGVVEENEVFLILVSSNPPVTIDPDLVSVTITNSDRIVIGFETENPLLVTESDGAVSVCAVILSGIIERDIDFTVQVLSGTATETEDYFTAQRTGTFASGTSTNQAECVHVATVTDDQYIENTEDFSVEFSGEFANVISGSIIIRVSIMDNDGATVTVKQPTISTMETDADTSVAICVVLTSILDSLERSVTVNLTAIVDPARLNDFDLGNNVQLTFPPSSVALSESCTDLTIIGDNIREDNEIIEINLVAVNPIDIITAGSVTVTIIDDVDFIEDCGPLDHPTGGTVSTIDTIENSTAVYDCDIGYNILGSNTRTCQTNGLWTGSAPTCTIVQCPRETPDNGEALTPDGTEFGDQVEYRCNDGYTLKGVGVQSCLASGQWSDSLPVCAAFLDCGPLDDPDNGRVSFTTTTFGSVASYTCNNNYILSGNTSRTCDRTCQWSGNDTLCIAGPDVGSVSSETIGIVIGVVVGVLAVLIAVVMIILIAFVCFCNKKKSRRTYSMNYSVADKRWTSEVAHSDRPESTYSGRSTQNSVFEPFQTELPTPFAAMLSSAVTPPQQDEDSHIEQTESPTELIKPPREFSSEEVVQDNLYTAEDTENINLKEDKVILTPPAEFAGHGSRAHSPNESVPDTQPNNDSCTDSDNFPNTVDDMLTELHITNV